MGVRRGFKTEANSLAIQLRKELGLRTHDPLNPEVLAEHLLIPVARFSNFVEQAPLVAALLGERSEEVSALTVHHGSRRMVLVNDSHPVPRQKSSLCHELAHGLLLHEPHTAVDELGCRHWNGDYEEEANLLAGYLLIPNEAARLVAQRGVSDERARTHFGVSQEMLTWRLNMSGARRMKSYR